MGREKMKMGYAVLFLAACLGAGPGCARHGDSGAPKPAAVAKEAVRVRITQAQTRIFEEKIDVQGTLSAKNYANVSARIPGTLTAIYVNEGDTVVRGKTKLFEVDSIKLRNAVEIGRQEYAVAEQGVKVAEAGLEQVNAQLGKIEADLKRLTSLYEKEVVSKDTLEKAQSGYDQIIAGKKQAMSAVLLSKERLKQAGVALEISGKDLSDATIYAPISGRVAARFVEIGEMAAPGIPVIRIEDTTLLEASAFLPAQYYERVTEGETAVRLEVSGKDLGARTVTYKSATINPKLRTFEVKTVIENPPAGVAPGAMAGFSAALEKREAPGIPSGCLQVRSGRNAVFVVEGNKGALRNVKTGLETGGYTEILDEGLKPDDRVISEGQNFLNDGDRITISGEAE